MSIQSLEHYTIRTADLAKSVEFYTNVVGLRSGDRPDFSFPGAWMYCGERAVVHLIGGAHDKYGTGSLDHVAFRAIEREAYVKKLDGRGERYEQRKVPGFPLHQVFLFDPDGVKIELNFWEDQPVEQASAPAETATSRKNQTKAGRKKAEVE